MPLVSAGKARQRLNPSQKTGREIVAGCLDRQHVFPQGESMENQIDHAFSDAERAAVYRTIFNRRDVRASSCPTRCRTRCSPAC
jgi:hypothetical protein